MGKHLIVLTLILLFGIASLIPIIPSPKEMEMIDQNEIVISELFSPRPVRGDIGSLPQDVLILMVEFADVKFTDTITNQDYLTNPDYTLQDYIGRFMFHVQSYYLDASYEAYEINYTVCDTLITLPSNMSVYGSQTNSLERRVQLVQDVVAYIDPYINFADYDAYIMMHAGAGRETDIYGTNPNAISSSFMNRRLMQAVLDPDNDEFPGIPTDDGVYVQEMVISATNHDHPDNPEDLNYGILGLLVHLFGRQMGLPTLFGNVSNLGRAAGAGNFCAMGTGVWNANGFVPPFLSAWTRTFAGWAEPVTIRQTANDIPLTYPFNPEDLAIPRVYKVPISDEEYYLVENRQQNPDDSILEGEPNFTFKLLPPDEQDYYPPPYEDVPRFNFMKNTYRGCEWDFYLPGLGGPDYPLIDGSGILIWHIDENIIRENYEYNTINANPAHQGVTLQEADGIQHLRSSLFDIYMRGSPYDSFRAGHNDYFGKYQLADGTISLPFVQSYYGETDLEIFDISSSLNIMTFSVNFPWTLEYPYEGDDVYPAAIVEDEFGDLYLLQTTESGSIFLFKNFELLPQYPLNVESIPHLYTYTEDNHTFIIPVQSESNGAAYYKVSPSGYELIDILPENPHRVWVTHPITFSNIDSVARSAFAFYNTVQDRSEVILYSEEYVSYYTYTFANRLIASNLIQKGEELLFFTKRYDNSHYELQIIDLIEYSHLFTSFPRLDSKDIESAIVAPLTKEEIEENIYRNNIIVLTSEQISSRDEGDKIYKLYMFYENGSLCNGFPIEFSEQILSVPSLDDVTGNGYLDILLVSSNNLYVVGYNGEIHSAVIFDDLAYPEVTTQSLGVIALDVTGNGNSEIIANLGGNRFVIWNNQFQLLDGYPLMLPEQPRNYPLPVFKADAIDIYLSAEQGLLFRHTFYPQPYNPDTEAMGWFVEYGDLQRSAYYSAPLPDNPLETDKIFIKEHCYAFPVPLTYQNGGVLYFNIMVSQNLPVEVKIFDISGKQIFKEIHECQAYTNNRNKVFLDINGLATGVYFAILKAKGETVTLKFAVEK
ncbi:MAG: T9SS type A sorting domain-containing protein [Candidatus Cloacimonetes bacterium]|nr:T9SS type A sorting domain-containing protein [Candidatus Cloacimonadota bacterium]